MALSPSMVISNSIELLGAPGGVPSTNPLCPGARFMLQPGWDLGEAQPTNDFVGTLALDGERPFGRRASDRTVTLPLQISAPDFTVLAGALEVLSQAIDAQQWTLAYTRDPSGPQAGGLGVGLPLVLDCFRAQASQVTYGGADGAMISPTGALTITCQALPYGRSDQPVIIPVASPIPGQSAPPAPVVLDTFSSVSGTNFASSTRHIVGPHSAAWSQGGSSPSPFYAESGLSLNLTGLTALSVWLGVAANFPGTFINPCTVMFSLTDNAARSITFSVSRTLTPGSPASVPNWRLITAQIPQGRAFNYANVTAYSLNASSAPASVAGIFSFGFNTWYDHLVANPPSVQIPGARGAVYNLLGVAGTARAPIAVQAQQPGATTTDILSTPGPGLYRVPSTLVGTTVDVTTLSGSGAGASVTGAGQGGGGSAGGLAREPALGVTPGELLPYVVGAGGTPQTGIATLAVLSSALPNGTSGVAYSFTLTASGGSGTGYTWARTGTALPSALTLTSGTGVIAGTPAAAATTSGMIFTVTDSLGATASVTLALVVKTAAALAITTTSLPNGATSAAYSQALATNGLGTPPLTWSVSAGTLPPGLALAAATGVISGVPTATGTSSFTASVTDSASHTDTQALSIVVTSVSVASKPLVGFNSGQGAFGGDAGGAFAAILAQSGIAGQSFGWRGYGGAGGSGPGNFPTTFNDHNTIPATATFAVQSWAPDIPTVLAGGCDAAITAFGVSCQKAWNADPGSLYVALWHEGDRHWTSAQFLAAHAYVYPRFKAACRSVGGAKTVPYGQITTEFNTGPSPSSWVSCPATVAGGSKLDFYGLDGYTDVSNSDGSATGYRTPTAVFSTAFNGILSLVPTATLMIGEANCETYANRAAWFALLWTMITTGPYPCAIFMSFWAGSNGGNVITYQTDDTPGTGTVAEIRSIIAAGAPDGALPPAFDPPAVDGVASSFTGDSVTVTEAGGKSATGTAGATFASISTNTVHEPGGAGAAGAASGGAGPGSSYVCAQFGLLSAGLTPSVPVTAAVSLGDALVVTVSVATGTVTSLADSQGNTYSLIDSEATATLKAYAFQCLNVAHPLTTSDHFLPVQTTATAALNCVGLGVSGVLTSAALDVSGIGTTATSAAPSVGPSPTLAQSSEWVIGIYVGGNGGGLPTAWTGLSGATARGVGHATTGHYLAVNDLIVSATTAKTAACTVVSTLWGMILVSLKFSSGGGAAFGGGGGSAPSATAAGGAGTLSAGGIPPAGAAAGGPGSPVADTLPSPGAGPGAGSGGAASSGAAMQGAPGLNGQILVKRTTSQQSFSSLILHTPGPDAPQALSPLVPFGGSPVIADGTIEYPVPSLVAGVNAAFGGTYSVLAVAQQFDTPATTRTLIVTVSQYEYAGGPVFRTSVQRTFTPVTDVTNGMVEVGTMTLPIKDIAPDNTQAFFTVMITDTDAADTWLDAMFIDTQGQTVWLNDPAPAAHLAYYVDAPAAANDVGRVLGTSSDRTAAVSVIDKCAPPFGALSGGPLTVYPGGDNLFMVYAREGSPQLQLSYFPSWYIERLS